MISGNIEFIYKHAKRSITIEKEVSELRLSDGYVLNLFEKHHIELEEIDPTFFEFTVSAARDTLIIEDLTLFEKVRILSFSNTKASLGLLVVNDIKIEIVGVFIDMLRTNCNWVHISRTLIRSFDFSQTECDQCQISGEAMSVANLLELNYVTVEKMTVYKSVEELIIKSSKIDRLDMDQVNRNQFRYVNITWNTHIEEYSVAGDIDRLRIKNSIINKVSFKETKIKKLDNKKSDINMVFMLEVDKIEEKNISAWELLYKAALNDDNDTLFAKAGYEINHMRRKDQSFYSRISSSILRVTIGYGYRPYRSIIFSIIAISLFAMLYQGLDYMSIRNVSGYQSVSDFMSHYFDMWYLSGTAYTTTGFGDIVPSNGITKVLVIFEAMVGVSVLSLFMYSLLNRYGKKQ